jgi:hypothetical protein
MIFSAVLFFYLLILCYKFKKIWFCWKNNWKIDFFGWKRFSVDQYRWSSSILDDYRPIWMIDNVRDSQLGARWYFSKNYLPQMKWYVHLGAWLSSSSFDYRPQWLIIISNSWLFSRVNSHHLPSWMNIVLLGTKSAAANEYRSHQMIIICGSFQ